MPLNKLENFIKNTEGRILYVNPNDLDATDSITNEGNSLTKPFKTIQRALLESARFTYRRGINNDKNDQTTILVFPGEHVIDNRPGWGIVNQSGAKAWRPSDGNASQAASDVFDLNLESNFDLTQEDNILYKFNSVYGGTIIPRGTSLVGLDLRKTKIRPKYVPNPTDSAAKRTAIFRITGNCYFWQFSIFDADESGTVYTSPVNFTETAKPTFSHHKLTCFEYADGVNIPKNISSLFAITDLDMYYAKLSNAYNTGSDNKNIDQKWPSEPLGFAKERPEWEIVGAFATDPLTISNIYSGDGSTSSSIVTVQTTNDHNLTVDTPIKINGVGIVGELTANYNISTKVQSVQSANTFTYVIPYIDSKTPAAPTFSGATVTVETDTVKGGSPYIFNISLRSVWGMNGMLADGSKASGFRSMVVAQFTGVSLQKDDRAFVKYNVSSRDYDAIDISKVTGPELSTQSSSINVNKVYHLDSGAIYRSGWESSHIKAINDSFIQIVSVFAIGFNKHFDSESGGDLSITNSNSNFGQISLAADGFKVDAFGKDDHAYVTSIITPRAIVSGERNIDWFAIDVGVTTQVGISSHLYIFGFNGVDQVPPIITQGYRVGSRNDDKLYVNFGAITGYGVSEASIYMLDNVIETGIKTALGTTSAVKELSITTAPTTSNTFTFTTSGNHNLNTGETVKIVSEVGDIPEGLIDHQTYYIIKISANQFQLASSLTNAKNGSYIRCYLGEQLLVRSRVSEKYPGEVGSPVQFDTERNKWFVHVNANNQIYNTLSTLGVSGIGLENTQTSFIKRIEDTRSLDEKIYKVRVVIPKESVNAKNPEDAFIIQESNATNISSSPLDSEFNLDVITSTDYDWDRNPRFISGISTSGSIVTVISELPHNLKQGNIVKITNVVSSDNASATDNIGYNGSFMITEIVDDKTFKHSTTDIFELSHLGTFGTFQNNTANRTTSLPRFQRVDLKTNYYIYRNEVISQHIQDVQDGIYHLYVLKADRQVTEEFTNLKHSQNVVNLYPELDRDNVNDSPTSAYSYSKRNPIGDVVTNDLKRSLTKEAIDTFVDDFGFGMQINAVTRDNVSGIATLTFARPHNLSGIVSCTISNAGTTYTGVGTYHNVKIFSDSSRTTWNGATARVTVSSGATISGVSVITGGSGYSAGTYYLDDVLLGKGAGTQATISVASNQLSSQVENVVQVTGIGSISDSYYRITGVGATNKIAIALTSGDPLIASGQYAFQIGPSISINSALSSYNSTTGISTITCTSAHGLVSGNKFRIVSIGNTNLGDYVVSERVGVNTFTTKTNANLPLTSGRILKHGFSANDAISDSSGENLGTRGVTFFDNEIATLEENVVVGVSTFAISTSGISTSSRFSIGDYIQIDDEIMRVSKSSLTGLNELSVIRGYFGSNRLNHDKGSLIRKIKVLPIEFRRPSVIRASGHTFEYLGFGPGNYSTGLPQIQDRTLTEREDFLGQSQERSCGSVVYTGMNNRGDFYIGNKRVTSATGEEKTFDAPVPTVTGEDPSRLSAVFDEVTIKERLKVEGGKSKTILSQFDGPVTFTNNVKVTNADLEIIDGKLLVSDTTESVSKDTGALIVEGGVGIERDVYVGGNSDIAGTLTVTDNTTFNKNVTLVGSNTAATEYFKIQNSSSNDKFVVDSFNGNTTIQGTAQITGITTCKNNMVVEGDLYVGKNTGGDTNIYFYNDSSDTYASTIQFLDTQQTLDSATVAEDTFYFSNRIFVNGQIETNGDITAFSTSDERLKDDITPIDDPLAKVLSISGNTFNWNAKSEKEGPDVGVIAQEIIKVLPEAVTTRDNGYLAVRYEKLVPLLIEAIKELKAEIDELKTTK